MRRSRKSNRTISPLQKTLRALYRIGEASIVTGKMIEMALAKAKRGEIGAYSYWNAETEAMEAYKSVQAEAHEARRLVETLLDLMPLTRDEGEVLL